MSDLMNINEFVNALNEKLQDYYGDDYTVRTCTVTKNNDNIRYGLTIHKNGENAAPTIYIDEKYTEYLEGKSISDITSDIITVRSACRDRVDFNVDIFSDYELVKERFGLKLVSKENNAKLLQDVPHMDFADLTIVFVVNVCDENIGNGTILIHNEHMNIWGVSVDRLYEDARNASVFRDPPYLADIMNILMDIYKSNPGLSADKEGFDIKQQLDSIRPKRNAMYVLTNQRKTFGASVITYPGMLHEIGQRLGSDYYVLPSSIHEVLIVPLDNADSRGDELSAIVKEVNDTRLDPEEILSDHAYRYHRNTHWLEPLADMCVYDETACV